VTSELQKVLIHYKSSRTMEQVTGLSTLRVYRRLRIVLTNIGHARNFCMTSRLIFPEAGTLCTTSTVKIWIYRPGGLCPETFPVFLCSMCITVNLLQNNYNFTTLWAVAMNVGCLSFRHTYCSVHFYCCSLCRLPGEQTCTPIKALRLLKKSSL